MGRSHLGSRGREEDTAWQVLRMGGENTDCQDERIEGWLFRLLPAV
jgi:hypothetical protein